MRTYERGTRVRAPLEAVWDFHSRTAGLEALTPDWMGLRVDAVIGPDGERDPDILRAGSELDCSTRPFGVGPRSHWTSVIIERNRRSGSAHFRDEMVRGPFDHWVHTHSFFADGPETIVRDHVSYSVPAPASGFGALLDRAAWVGFEPMFRYRHRRTRELLEGRTADPAGGQPGESTRETGESNAF